MNESTKEQIRCTGKNMIASKQSEQTIKDLATMEVRRIIKETYGKEILERVRKEIQYEISSHVENGMHCLIRKKVDKIYNEEIKKNMEDELRLILAEEFEMRMLDKMKNEIEDYVEELFGNEIEMMVLNNVNSRYIARTVKSIVRSCVIDEQDKCLD